MFYTIGNKRFMTIQAARAYAYTVVKGGKSTDITRITAEGAADAGTVLMMGKKVLYSPFKGRTYVLNRDGSVRY